MNRVVANSPGLFRGPAPESRDDVRALFSRGVRTIISFQSHCGERDQIEQEAMWVLWVRREMMSSRVTMQHQPLSIIRPPTHPELVRAVDLIRTGLGRGAVYAHCNEGLARTNCVLWAYNVWVRGKEVYDSDQEMNAWRFNLLRYFWWSPVVARSIRRGM